jgi:hypothetical protein
MFALPKRATETGAAAHDGATGTGATETGATETGATETGVVAQDAVAARDGNGERASTEPEVPAVVEAGGPVR